MGHDVASTRTRLVGHGWTLLPYGVAAATTPPVLGGIEYRASTEDPVRGSVPVVGVMHRAKVHSRRLVVVIHGITATPKDAYVRQMVRALTADGSDVLSLALRGATCVGSDHYHAGLTDDLETVFSDPRLAQYDEIFVVGFSMGGQVGLRFGLLCDEPRLRGLVGFCPPISMAASQVALDAPEMAAYRLAILSLLKRRYRRLARNGLRDNQPVMAGLEVLRGITTFYEWDRNIVCPRFGYASVDAYYQDVSVGPHLAKIRAPCLLILGREDPLVPFHAIEPLLHGLDEKLDIHVSSPGGHLGFPLRADIGQGRRLGMHHQVTHWIRDH